ncbi:amidase signature domain-containing protein [Penicillium waksmanii]|uniref:amidase signature domain-containing protein n=1 Tax=Penicillium waksmanii TaxID=69791 RepID=UPI00254795E5|nr:amidase signature domain-containing protein [Penicillium waksmanii]KAJ6000884.1 amidase signature domain-containing protein [Penicillium waksmanii]
MVSPEWQLLIDEKRAHRDACIPFEWRVPKHIVDKVSPEATVSAFDLLRESELLTERDNELTELYDATSLLELLAAKIVSSVEVTTAFCKRAAIAQQLTNSLTEIFFDEAIARARSMDEYLQKAGKPMGPFHGLPISVKDMFDIEGQFTTLGYVAHLKNPKATNNVAIVDILLRGGAVLYCKTTVPQALFAMEGFNYVFGQAMNPHKLCLGTGGSSSGEGALVAFRGSVLGVGSDMGGSIRAPSLCNGTFGVKLSANRLPYKPQKELFPKGWPGIMLSIGPHANSARDLTLFCKSVLQMEPWRLEPRNLAIPWRNISRKEHLKIAVWLDDPDFPVSPPVSRIMASAVDALRKAGHQVRMLTEPPSLLKAFNTARKSLSFDTDQTAIIPLRKAGEKMGPILEQIFEQAPGSSGTPGLSDVLNVNASKEDLREQLAKIWQGEQLDALICPGSRNTAVPHGEYGIPAWTMIWNLLDFPASVIPYLKADKFLDDKSMDEYNADVVHGAPGSIQVVGWPLQDEELLMATEVISSALCSASDH